MGAVRLAFDKLYSNYSDPEAFGISEKVMLMRKVCDHIAGMTDHYAIEEFKTTALR